jgi:hypothetical protein
MADNRVLNYSEFAGKYQKNAEQDIAASYSEFSKASDNFQEGFDEDTYEDGQAGPKRPIAQSEETTPAQPGEDGAPNFTAEPAEGMEAPGDEDDSEEDFDVEDSEAPEDNEIPDEDELDADGGNPEGDEDDSEEEEGDEDDSEEEEEDTNESVKVIRRNLILESFDEFEARGPINSQPRSNVYDDELDNIELDFDFDDEDEDSGECFVSCKACGAKKEVASGEYPMGADNEANPDSWWQGSVLGMQCGCTN